MDEPTRRIFKAAGFDVKQLTRIPAKSVHEFQVAGDAWLDPDAGLLMFVGAPMAHVHRFMYYIGEEHNHRVVGVGRGIVAYQITEERVRLLLSWLAEYGAKLAGDGEFEAEVP
jgi:hypothetical protein